MFLRDVFMLSASNIRTNTVRTILTAMAVAIGVSSVMLIVSLSAGGQQTIENELDKLGIHGLTVFSKDASGYPLTASDAAVLQERIPEIVNAAPIVLEYASYRLKHTDGDAVIWGVGNKIDNVLDIELIYGRLPNETDVRFSSNVAVIDSELAEKVYKRRNIVGKSIRISLGGNSEDFEIIGIISPQKDGFNQLTGGIIPDFIYLPYTTVNIMRKSSQINQIAIKCSSELSLEKTGEKAKELLERRYNTSDNYTVENLSGHIKNLKSITGMIGLLLSAIASISLCVSGLGIMNTMLSSMGERRREIGICMAIGARRKDILVCFLTESAIISAIGGVIGGLAGLGLAALILNYFNMPFAFSVKSLLIIECISILCGIAFAILPANKASKLNPITALRED